jgi:hypothetical protein
MPGFFLWVGVGGAAGVLTEDAALGSVHGSVRNRRRSDRGVPGGARSRVDRALAEVLGAQGSCDTCGEARGEDPAAESEGRARRNGCQG